MAREAGVSKSTVQRIWNHNDIKPHRLETFKISNDPNFEEKFWDVIGLYLDPPEKAVRWNNWWVKMTGLLARCEAGSQVFLRVTNFKSLRQVASYAI